MGQLDGKVAIVTGTSRGVGVGISRRLLMEGASVAGCSRRPMDGLPAAEGIEGADARSVQWVCDQSDWGAIDEFVGRVVERFGRLDILVNNAGGTMPIPHVEEVPELIAKISGTPPSESVFGRTALFHAAAVHNNLTGPLWFALRAHAAMTAKGGTGSIVNISSGASHPAGSPTLVSYGAAKSGLNHLTRSLAEEWGPSVRVNCLALGATMTDNFQAFVLPDDDPEGSAYFESVPLGRAGTPDEVGAACVFLCSGQADYINGTTIEIDGGMLPGTLYDAGRNDRGSPRRARGDLSVRLAFTPEQVALEAELRTYFAALAKELDAEQTDESSYTRGVRRMGADGWLGLGWPPEYGGQGRGPIDQMIFVEESHWAGVPLPLLTLNSVGPTLMALGTDDQKRELLPRILRGELHFAIGYTEPTAGTDLAALKTRAVRDGDEYVVNGQKLFTSAIEHADYVWLAVRTDPDAPKHKGLSVLLVPTDVPGFHWTPLRTMAGGGGSADRRRRSRSSAEATNGDGEFTSATFYEDVRVPVDNLVGEENQGWKLITNQLNHERVAICPASGTLRSIDEVRRWAQHTKLADGRRVIDQEWVRTTLARVYARAEYLKLMNWKVAWAADKGLSPADASATKVFGTEFALEAYRLLMEVVGADAYLEEGSPGAVLAGRLERSYRAQTIFTFGGGTNEIQRDIIAMVGLGMPRAPR